MRTRKQMLHAARQRRHREKNRERYNEKSRQYSKAWRKRNADRLAEERCRPEAIAYRMFNGARHRARSKGMKFDLRLDDIVARVKHGRCELTGIKFDMKPRQKGVHYRKYGPALDRKNPKKGYVRSNVRIICNHANMALNEYGEAAFAKLCRAYLSHVQSVH